MAFRREFLGYSGGHGKVWDYYRHVQAHPGWRACIHFSPDSIADGNPWRDAGEEELEAWPPSAADAMFLAGMDWLAWPHDLRSKPVINLVQGVRHADPSLPLHGFLSRPAVRICVGQPVADALTATGQVRGPVFVIDSGIDVDLADRSEARPLDVFIAAQKRPELGMQVAERLRRDGIGADCLSAWLPRRDFLARMRRARVAILLPLAREGFYLPGLEAMALGCAVVMPDAIGNRAYAVPGRNALVPPFDADAIATRARDLLHDPPALLAMAEAGSATAARHDLARESAAFHRILDHLDESWADAWAATSH